VRVSETLTLDQIGQHKAHFLEAGISWDGNVIACNHGVATESAAGNTQHHGGAVT
jgi:hypothetical protein